MSVQIGSVVTIARRGDTQYVVAEIVGGPEATGDYAKLVRKRSDGSYTSFLQPFDGLVEEHFSPFREGEAVKINGIPETGAFIDAVNGIARVAMPGWSKPLQGVGNLAIPEAEARVSFWSLVLENRL